MTRHLGDYVAMPASTNGKSGFKLALFRHFAGVTISPFAKGDLVDIKFIRIFQKKLLRTFLSVIRCQA